MVTVTTGEALVQRVRALVGVPFRHAGTNREGVDCAGVILLPARELGLCDFDPGNYSPHPEFSRGLLLEGLALCCERIDITWPATYYNEAWLHARAGDIGLFAATADEPHHLAMFTGTANLIHASQRAKQVVEKDGRGWCRFLVSVWRFPGLSDD